MQCSIELKPHFNKMLLQRSSCIEGGAAAVPNPVDNGSVVTASEYKSLLDALFETKADNARLKRENEMFGSRCSDLENRARHDASERKNEMDRVHGEVEALRKINVDLRRESQHLNERLIDETQKSTDLERRLCYMQDQYERVRAEMRRLEAEMRRLEAEMCRLQSDNKHLRPFQTEACELSKKNMDLEARNAMLMNQFLDMQLKLSAATGCQHKEKEEEKLCTICMSCSPTCLFKTCGHVSCCEDCSRILKECPVCRTEKNSDDHTTGFSKFVRLPECCNCEKKRAKYVVFKLQSYVNLF
jgi:predicted nuclease with TOPRIM domain